MGKYKIKPRKPTKTEKRVIRKYLGNRQGFVKGVRSVVKMP